MNNKPNPDRSFIHFMLRAQQLSQQDTRSDKGYAMMMTSIVSIAMFSMLAAYMTMTNLSKSSTNAYVDGTNTFYTAESGLNRRAEQLRQRFIGYASPDGLSPGQLSTASVVSPTAISNCFSQSTTAPTTTNDFECRNYAYRYTNSSASVKGSNEQNDLGASAQVSNQTQTIGYTAYTFVADRTNYINGSKSAGPIPQVIPAGQTYAGLNAQEYWYTVYSTAAKPDPTNPSNPVQASDAKTVLQMNFKSRVVPLFQFAVFYDGDLEMNSSANMTISGLVHTNANLYVQPYSTGGVATTFLSPVTAAGKIYNRVDAVNSPMIAFGGITQVLMTGTSCVIAANCKPFPPYSGAVTIPLTAAQLNVFGGNVKDGGGGAIALTVPEPGFLRKRNYVTNAIGEYYAKADMRLEMVPDRDVLTFNASPTPWARNKAIIPFNFTAITTGGTGTCTTALPAAGSDPVATYIDPNRTNATSLRCNIFTKGQLQSLRQPVLVLTNINQTDVARRTIVGAVPSATSESAILGNTAALNAPAGLSATVKGNVTTTTSIVRALQVALASTPSPVELNQMGVAFDPTNTGAFLAFRTEFIRLISNIPVANLPAADLAILSTATPNQIAALGGAWFLPAPIQRVEPGIGSAVTDAVRNPRGSGFYDGRERKWITMLQTNLKSLSVWNRDGLYVEATIAPTGTGAPDANLLTAYQTNNDMKDAAFNVGAGASFTDGLAFDRAAADATKSGLQLLGLGSIDQTEGGLVFHATVSDDLNGDGTIAAATDVTPDTANPVLKQNPDGTNVIVGGATVTIDYPRKYRGGANFQSPF
jgi:hypothetical protein